MFFYSTDCNFIVKVMKTNTHYECYTKEQVMSHINQPTGTIIYKVLRDGSLERLGAVKPNTEIFVKIQLTNVFYYGNMITEQNKHAK